MSREGEFSGRKAWGLESFQLGIALGGASTAAEWQRDLDRVESAERYGLHSVWVPEMHFARRVTASPLVALSAFAARTQRIRLATTSLLLPIHDPRELADEISALDRASKGRSLIGLGRGFRAPLFRAFGIDPQTKRDRFDAALDAMLAVWKKGSDATERVARSPVQKPHPPLAVAAFGPKGLAQASRRGLPYLPSPLESTELLAENLQRHREALPAEVDPRHIVVPVMRTVFVAANEAEAAAVRERLAAEARGMPTNAPQRIARAAAVPISERVVVAPAAEALDQLAALRERLGIDLLIASSMLPGVDEAARQDAFARLCEEVWPALRRP